MQKASFPYYLQGWRGWGGAESPSWHSLSLFPLPFEARYPCLPLWASVFLCCLQRFRRMGSLSGATVSGWCGQDRWGAFSLQSCLKRAHWSEAHLAWKAAPSLAWALKATSGELDSRKTVDWMGGMGQSWSFVQFPETENVRYWHQIIFTNYHALWER